MGLLQDCSHNKWTSTCTSNIQHAIMDKYVCKPSILQLHNGSRIDQSINFNLIYCLLYLYSDNNCVAQHFVRMTILILFLRPSNLDLTLAGWQTYLSSRVRMYSHFKIRQVGKLSSLKKSSFFFYKICDSGCNFCSNYRSTYCQQGGISRFELKARPECYENN